VFFEQQILADFYSLASQRAIDLLELLEFDEDKIARLSAVTDKDLAKKKRKEKKKRREGRSDLLKVKSKGKK